LLKWKFTSGEENFHELLGQLVGSNEQLIDEALYLMRYYSDYESATKFVQKFNIPSELIPNDILELINGHPKAINVTQVEDDWETDSVTTNTLLTTKYDSASRLNYCFIQNIVSPLKVQS